MNWPHTASSYTVGPQAYQVTFAPSGSRGTNGVLPRVKLLYMDRGGSVAFAASAGAGGGVHSGIAVAMAATVGRNEDLDVAERNRLLKGIYGKVPNGRQMHRTEKRTINRVVSRSSKE